MRYYIVTGSSKGIGSELALQLLGPEHHVIGISRTPNDSLSAYASQHGHRYDWLPFDLTRSEQIGTLAEQLLVIIDRLSAESITLINNAATLTPLDTIDHLNCAQLSHALHLNLMTPMMLTSTLIQLTNGYPIERLIINISSGSGSYPAPGMSVYCSAKAALNMFSQCIQAESAIHGRLRCVSVDPGMVDTAMQEVARSDAHDHPMRGFFTHAEQNHQLRSPQYVAQRILSDVIFSNSGSHHIVID
ncbi:benzil reductase ((S)-benzoin forming) [Paenibacillus cellulosilyticus]|uniref:Benzil reductase ((S)-benzoin forming) n=1 Tax=Paenibacillus cellulosilyticus TaxID=375489 RepID=A0A2V2YYQ2_9BACL|nr:SDR family NAD(P)-dependent oxidoreductase [Paenibacillus cellulosilyticus]PWW07378.1 benzil reductase ((S)-benzoin forming) [Paenibacillus cellulosilyticus]QKS44453.1 SDR family NAD(P)-dependent oxidoreductase [Paenibacillus cellulosilyticus]